MIPSPPYLPPGEREGGGNVRRVREGERVRENHINGESKGMVKEEKGRRGGREREEGERERVKEVKKVRGVKELRARYIMYVHVYTCIYKYVYKQSHT